MALKVLAAVVGVGALCALVATSASATTLCMVNTSPCPAGSEYKEGQVITGVTKGGTVSLLDYGTGSVTCQKSTLKLTTSAVSGTPLKGSATTWAFNEAECKLANNQKCSRAESLDLPYAVEIEATGGGGGNLKLKSSGNGPPKVWHTCGLFDCIFEKAEVVLSVTSTAGTAIATAKSLTFTKAGGTACPANPGVWSAEYELSPKPLYIVAKP